MARGSTRRRQHWIIEDLALLLKEREGILTETQVVHLIYLERLVKFYARFMNRWDEGEVYIQLLGGKPLIRVKWSRTVSKKDAFDGTVKEYVLFTEREFTLDKLKARILSYKRKIRREFENRHKNPKVNGNKTD